MKAVILAAGKGTRMLPLTLEKPKPMLEVLGKPILHHMFDVLPDAISDVILVVGYKGDQIREYVGDEFLGKKVKYFEQTEQKGPLHAVRLVEPLLALRPDESFLLLFADDLYRKEDVETLLHHPRSVLVHEVEHPERFGIVLVDEEGRIKEIEEKPEHPKSNLAVTGAYVFDSRVFEYAPELHRTGEFFLPPVIQKMAEDHGVYAKKAGLWIPIGYPEDLEKAEEILRERIGLSQ